jgi:hypothetical protein
LLGFSKFAETLGEVRVVFIGGIAMKALTIIQPWASLIAIGAKRFATRIWDTEYRGPLAIHAGATKPSDVLNGVDVDVIFAMGRVFGVGERHIGKIMEYLDALPRGAVVAATELIGCWPMRFQGVANSNADGPIVMYTRRSNGSFYEHPSENEHIFGDWRPGRFVWEISNAKPLSTPVPARGKQGLWDWDGRL